MLYFQHKCDYFTNYTVFPYLYGYCGMFSWYLLRMVYRVFLSSSINSLDNDNYCIDRDVYIFVNESITIVTGPSFINETFISAPKIPLSILRPDFESSVLK